MMRDNSTPYHCNACGRTGQLAFASGTWRCAYCGFPEHTSSGPAPAKESSVDQAQVL